MNMGKDQLCTILLVYSKVVPESNGHPFSINPFYGSRLSGQIKTNLGIGRVRADTFGYLQRSFAGLQSETDVDEARQCGRQAVLYSMKEDNGSVAMKRLGNGADYAVELFRTNLSEVAEHTKSVPDEFINADGNGMTDAFIEYAMPLVGQLPKTEYIGNYPKA